MKTIKVNGRETKVLNSYSGGPGDKPTAYDTSEGYVVLYGTWQRERPGCFPEQVTVEA